MTDTLSKGEVHPAADSAFEFVLHCMDDSATWQLLVGSLAKQSLDGDRLACICLGTISRIEKRDKISDRYLLGLAWTLCILKGKIEWEQNQLNMDNQNG